MGRSLKQTRIGKIVVGTSDLARPRRDELAQLKIRCPSGRGGSTPLRHRRRPLIGGVRKALGGGRRQRIRKVAILRPVASVPVLFSVALILMTILSS